MNKPVRHIAFALFCAGCLLALMGSRITDDYRFSEEDMREIQAEVAKRVAAFAQKQRDECQTELIAAVDAQVDTILMKDIRQLLRGDDSLSIPPPPPRPDNPDILQPEDDTPLQPLIDEGEWDK